MTRFVHATIGLWVTGITACSSTESNSSPAAASSAATNPSALVSASGSAAQSAGVPSNAVSVAASESAGAPSDDVPTGTSPQASASSPDAVGSSSAAASHSALSGAEAGAGETPDSSVPGNQTDSSVPLPSACDATQPPALGAIGLETVFSSNTLKTLSYAAQPPGSDAWYLIEQSGKIWILEAGQLSAAPFFDVSDEIQLKPDYDERGLHAIEFAPDYATSGLFYIAMTPTTGARANRDLVLEHQRSASDPNVADMTPTRELINNEGIAQDSLFTNIHNNYLIKFGPDGMLYVGTGDGGGSCNDNAGFEGHPQDISAVHGKILRLDLSQPAPYGATDNPFVASGDARVLHYGLRNPFRFSWDEATGDLYIGDVGQDAHEEINVAPAGVQGLNFGWPAYEGDETGTGMNTPAGGKLCPSRELAAGAQATMPVFFTDHGGSGNNFGAGCTVSPFCDYGAIVGGFVYRGEAIPELYGAYLFGDWVSDNLAAIYHCADATSEVTAIDYVRDLNLPNDGYLVPVNEDVPELSSITSILQDHDRELYLIANSNSLLKVVPAP